MVLTAQVSECEAGFVARVEPLALEGVGATVQQAQDELVQAMRSWIEAHEGRDDLNETLDRAGFPGVDEDTELQLEFGEWDAEKVN